MLRILSTRFKQKHRTQPFPPKADVMPERFRGVPAIDQLACGKSWKLIENVCPTDALKKVNNGVELDLGCCIFCGACEKACEGKGITFSRDYRMAVRAREDLHLNGDKLKQAEMLGGHLHKLFGRSLKLRQVSAAGCNACEADTNVLNTLAFDLGRFGIQFVASPRHADGLLITGPVSNHMGLALKKTYDAVPSPKIVIAVGACAIAGGPYIDHPEVMNGAAAIVPVDLFVPGCPPHPLTILDGLVRLLKKLDK
jgi:Ni,Fe-hydrogenase III small subunit/NAD-dependent dihydropyrimidine dehydrogenase PreA subunit